MKSADYIIPISNSGNADFAARVVNLNFVLSEFLAKQSQVDLRVYLVDQIIDPGLPQFSDAAVIPDGLNVCIKTVRAPVFCKPWLYNIGIAMSQAENVILADVDNWTDQDYFKDLISFVDAKELKWCMAWNYILFLAKEEKEYLIANGKFVPAADRKYGYPAEVGFPGNAGGALLYKRDFLCKELHGVNELFRRWGWEDSELLYRSFKTSGTYEKYPIDTMHLWHEVSLDNTWRGPAASAKAIKPDNEKLFDFIVRDHNYLHMNKVLAQLQLGNESGVCDVATTLDRHGIRLEPSMALSD